MVAVVEVEVQSPHVYGQIFSVFGKMPHDDDNMSQMADPSLHACPDAYGISLGHIKIKSLQINIMT